MDLVVRSLKRKQLPDFVLNPEEEEGGDVLKEESIEQQLQVDFWRPSDSK